jgi:hypothetical protein
MDHKNGQGGYNCVGILSQASTFPGLGMMVSAGMTGSGEFRRIILDHLFKPILHRPHLFVRYTSPQNRYKERKILLPEEWVTVYHEYQAQYGIDDRLFPWSPRRLEYLLEDLSDAAGLEKHLSFDMCRWTCALTDWQSGMEPDQIRQKLGVSKIQWREIRMKLRQLSGPE